MTAKQKEFFCPVCGELDLQLKEGILYCPSCKIFVGKPESFGETVKKANPAAAAQAKMDLARGDFVLGRLGKALVFLIRWINGFLLSLYGCLTLLYAGFLFISENAEAKNAIAFGAAYLFFGIFFWKLAADLETRERNSWWMAVAIHLISLALLAGGFLNPVDLSNTGELVGLASVGADLFDVLRIVYPIIIVVLLVAVRRHYIRAAPGES